MAVLERAVQDPRQWLVGATALVTGASRGIGRSIAMEFAHRGCNVAINANQSLAEAREVRDELRAAGVEAEVFAADVSRPEEARRLIEGVLGWKGTIDVLVNNAGITRDRSFRKMSLDEWHEVIQVNLNGVFYCTWEAFPRMVEAGRGRIVNISSVIAQSGAFGQANYASAKAGILGLTRSLALEGARNGITVNAVCPGYIDTEMLAFVHHDVRMQLLDKIPMRRFGLPEEVARLVTFLVAEADYVTGQTFNINGGLYLQ